MIDDCRRRRRSPRHVAVTYVLHATLATSRRVELDGNKVCPLHHHQSDRSR